jgi:hypothetical protein
VAILVERTATGRRAMARFMLHNTHRPEECESVLAEYAASAVPDISPGTAPFCTCPAGEHGVYVVVEAETAEEALRWLPPGARGTSRAIWGQPLGGPATR